MKSPLRRRNQWLLIRAHRTLEWREFKRFVQPLLNALFELDQDHYNCRHKNPYLDEKTIFRPKT